MKIFKIELIPYLVITIYLACLSCTKEEESEKGIAIGKISKIESLGNISLGQSDTILITFWGGSNGCAQPDHLEAFIGESTITFKAYYNYPKEAKICPENMPIHTLKYIFKPVVKGIYTYSSFDTDVKSITVVN